MSRPIDLGIFAETGKPFRADLTVVLRSNVLVQANSGGGKSWLLRRMIEQAYRRVPQIIIDPEGEFSTLRKQFDFVLVGKGGDTPADVRSAPLLAHRLLELGASAIIDLYEMSKSLRPVWAAAFVQALVDAPKKLWRDLLVYVDEAHELAPEPGHGTESRDEKMCRHALVDLAAKGRKRGYGVVAATQRLGKLSKDFAAELKNVLIGQTFIDIDRDRAANALGISKSDKQAFFADVKTLEPGAFHALGRAFTKESALVTIGDVQSEHPKPGARKHLTAPPPTVKIRHLLPQLADLPKEAEEKIQTEKELKMKISEQARRISELERAAKLDVPPPIVQRVGREKRVEVPVFREADLKRIEKLADRLSNREDVFTEQFDAVSKRFGDLVSTATRELSDNQKAMQGAIGKLAGMVMEARRPTLVRSGRMSSTEPNVANVPKKDIRGNKPGRREVDQNGVNAEKFPRRAQGNAGYVMNDPTDASDLPQYALDLLNVVAQRGKASDAQISTLSGYRRTSSAFGINMNKLVKAGLVVGSSRERVITDAGRERAGAVEALPTGRALLDHWLRKLTGYEALFLKTIYEAGTISREALAEKTGRSMTSSAFGLTLSALQRLELIEAPRGADLAISESFN